MNYYLNHQDKDGLTHLMKYSRRKKNQAEVIPLINELIKNGTNVNLKDNEGKTALMYAASSGFIEAAKLLLENKVEIDAQDNWGKTAFSHLFKTFMYTTPEFFKTEMVKILIEYGANMEIPDSNGNTPLMNAASLELALKLLLDAGVTNINAQNKEGNTALMYAVWSPKNVIMLLNAGADINLKNNEGKSVFDFTSNTTKKDQVIGIINSFSAIKEKNSIYEKISTTDVPIKKVKL